MLAGRCAHGEYMKKDNRKLVDAEINGLISDIGKLWKKSKNNPQVSKDILDKWTCMIKEWIRDSGLPLVVRKQTGTRGSEIKHNSGRRLIITDNSFAQWVYFNVLNGISYNINDIKKLLMNDEIPFSFAIKNVEKGNVKYKKCIGRYSINKLGWKLCHIEPIGFNSKIKLEELDIQRLEDHFFKMANPKNMFLLPLEIGAIGEIKEFIDEQL